MNRERIEQLVEGFGRSKMMQFFGAKLHALEVGYCAIEVDKQEFMARPAGMFNGSVIASLVDVSSGYAAASAKALDSYFVTVELKVNFLNPAYGDKLMAKARVLKNGKSLSVVQSDVYSLSVDGKEIHAATSLVTLMQVDNKNKVQNQ